ncbi:MAG: hypothetical protein Q4A32_00515 [Lachnospiraceae bacterium]|nr:hypothetical protein [Lachnospiraceae bacterium]
MDVKILRFAQDDKAKDDSSEDDKSNRTGGIDERQDYGEKTGFD